MLVRLGVCLLCAAVLSSAGPALAATPAPKADAALDRALRTLVAMDGGPPGVIALVQRGSQLKVHAFGRSDVATKGKPRADDHMRIASVAKAFSGATALSLVAKGVLSLDDTIGKRLPDLPGAWYPVTLRQLLNHTSGLPDFTRSPAFQEAVLASLAVAPPPRDLLDFVRDEPLEFAPGSRYQYSNSDNIVVGLMVEAATGRSYEDELAEQVLDPLGLGETSLPRGPELPEPFIHGYALDPPKPPEDISELFASGWAWASGGIISTPAELNRFIRGYLAGQLFGADVQAQQLEFVAGGGSEPPGPGKNAAGLALFRYQTRCGTVSGTAGTRSASRSSPRQAATAPAPSRCLSTSNVLRRTRGRPVRCSGRYDTPSFSRSAPRSPAASRAHQPAATPPGGTRQLFTDLFRLGGSELSGAVSCGFGLTRRLVVGGSSRGRRSVSSPFLEPLGLVLLVERYADRLVPDDIGLLAAARRRKRGRARRRVPAILLARDQLRRRANIRGARIGPRS